MAKLKLFLLGTPRLELEDGSPVTFDTRKAVALLAYLALGGQSYSRDTLATLLWPEYDQSQARANLRRTLSVLVKGIGPDTLVVDRESIGLVQENGLWVDVIQFQQLLAQSGLGRQPGSDRCLSTLPLLTQALELYQNDFMAGFSLRDSPDFEEWQFFQGESLRWELSGLLERLVSGYVAQGQFETALTNARRWLALDPLDEKPQRQLMQLYAWTGQRNAALRQYQSLARLLDEELEVVPTCRSGIAVFGRLLNMPGTCSRPTNGRC